MRLVVSSLKVILVFKKKMIRKNKKPLQQVVKRYKEHISLNTFENCNDKNTKLKFEKLHNEGPLINDTCWRQYKVLILEKLVIKIFSPIPTHLLVLVVMIEYI